MDFYLLVATASLTLQIAVFALLTIGYEYKRKLKFRQHGMTMLTALLLHLAAILTIMIPSFVLALVPITIQNPVRVTSILSSAHAIAGSITIVFAAWIVGGWRLRPSNQYCAPKKKAMRKTLLIWLLTLVLGIMLYFDLNWTLLFSQTTTG
jgi:uncharacterized membrane protein YozB (DUF420 family)